MMISPIYSLFSRYMPVYWYQSAISSLATAVISVTDTKIVIKGQVYERDKGTNITSNILSYLDRNLHNKKYHPLFLIKERIKHFFYSKFTNRSGNPLFSVYENINPIITLQENFDNLLVPKDHSSRKLSDSFYINTKYMLRAHTTAHDLNLIQSGLDNFLIIGDVYRRDSIDNIHFPVFHQVDGVRLKTKYEVFSKSNDASLDLFELSGNRTSEKQQHHSLEAVKLIEHELKTTLQELTQQLFGKNVETRWIETYFPFTHPSWELEVKYEGNWLEVLGCGILEHNILKVAGASNKIGWAFGLGLERLAMKLYSIPDIRLFWSQDSGFLSQFYVEDFSTPITYKKISVFPQCINDISFWIPEHFSSNDFYDLVRSIGGDVVEQVYLIDTFISPKQNRTSHCYRIVYRHMEKTFKQDEVNKIHKDIELSAAKSLKVEIR